LVAEVSSRAGQRLDETWRRGRREYRGETPQGEEKEKRTMKAVIEFELPEDRCEFTAASKALDWALAVWDIDQWLRNRIKHEVSDGVAVVELEGCRTKLHEILEKRSLSLEDIE